jgi:hypothetical protein
MSSTIPPHANSFTIGTAIINTHTCPVCIVGVSCLDHLLSWNTLAQISFSLHKLIFNSNYLLPFLFIIIKAFSGKWVYKVNPPSFLEIEKFEL